MLFCVERAHLIRINPAQKETILWAWGQNSALLNIKLGGDLWGLDVSASNETHTFRSTDDNLVLEEIRPTR